MPLCVLKLDNIAFLYLATKLQTRLAFLSHVTNASRDFKTSEQLVADKIYL